MNKSDYQKSDAPHSDARTDEWLGRVASICADMDTPEHQCPEEFQRCKHCEAFQSAVKTLQFNASTWIPKLIGMCRSFIQERDAALHDAGYSDMAYEVANVRAETAETENAALRNALELVLKQKSWRTASDLYEHFPWEKVEAALEVK